jgi:hypothetical protein
MLVLMTYRNGCEDILNEQNSLELQNEEVDKLMELGKNALQVLSGDSIVASGAEV